MVLKLMTFIHPLKCMWPNGIKITSPFITFCQGWLWITSLIWLWLLQSNLLFPVQCTGCNKFVQAADLSSRDATFSQTNVAFHMCQKINQEGYYQYEIKMCMWYSNAFFVLFFHESLRYFPRIHVILESANTILKIIKPDTSQWQIIYFYFLLSGS